MTKHAVAKVSEIAPGDRKIVQIDGISIGVFNVAGTFYALRNRCPHQGAPLCLGKVTGTALPSAPGEYHWARAGEILRCPWHGWEFDLHTGRSLFDPPGVRVRAYAVSVERVSGSQDLGGSEEERDGDLRDGEFRTAEEARVETYLVSVDVEWIMLHLSPPSP